MMYGVPEWIGAMAKKCNKILYTRVQCLMNIKMAKAYRTTSSEALSVLTGITPIEIKVAVTYIHTYIHTHTHEYTHAHINSHNTHTHTHTHPHTYI